jgi:RimJ/RimL family protein N-acetyltransferase
MKTDIFFRAIEPGDAEFINAMRRMDNMTALTGEAPRFVSLEREKKFVNDIIFGDRQDMFYVAICENGSDKIIGYTRVSEIDYFNRSCFWSGLKIDPSCAGKGYGLQTTLLILKHVFENLGMQRCIGMCFEEHTAMRKILDKAGYKMEGIQRRFQYKNGEFKDMCLYSVLSEEYEEIKRKFDL